MPLSGAETYLFLQQWSIRAGKQDVVRNLDIWISFPLLISLHTQKLWKQKTIPKNNTKHNPTNSSVILPSVGLFHWNSAQGTNLMYVHVAGITF